VQFGQQQRKVMSQNWKQGNWFWDKLEPLYQEMVAKAYGVRLATAHEKAYCQRITTLALSIFAQHIGSTKSKAVHAMQTGQHRVFFESLAPGLWKYGIARMAAMNDWQESFREAMRNGDTVQG